MDIAELRKLLQDEDYERLKTALVGVNCAFLLEVWSGLKSLEKLILFKLLELEPAMGFYSKLSFDEKYFLLCAFDVNSIAPVLEKLSPKQRALFVTLPDPCYDKMFHQVVSERVDITLSIQKN